MASDIIFRVSNPQPLVFNVTPASSITFSAAPSNKIVFKVSSICQTIGGGGAVPPGGETGEVLTKASNSDGDTEWKFPLPPGGNRFDLLMKQSSNDNDVAWSDLIFGGNF